MGTDVIEINRGMLGLSVCPLVSEACPLDRVGLIVPLRSAARLLAWPGPVSSASQRMVGAALHFENPRCPVVTLVAATARACVSPPDFRCTETAGWCDVAPLNSSYERSSCWRQGLSWFAGRACAFTKRVAERVCLHKKRVARVGYGLAAWMLASRPVDIEGYEVLQQPGLDAHYERQR